MKGRLITNGILSSFSIIFFILYILGVIRILSWEFIVIGVILFYIFLMPSFVMGIVTLSMEKHPSAHGLTITSGILAIIFSGFFGINIIISFLAVWKINQSEQNILTNKQN